MAVQERRHARRYVQASERHWRAEPQQARRQAAPPPYTGFRLRYCLQRASRQAVELSSVIRERKGAA